MPGSPPKPTHLKLITGNPGKRKLNKNEPKPTVSIPPVPDHHSDEAKVEWARIAVELNAVSLLTQVDRAALAAYCQAWADWVEAEEQLRRYGKVVKSPVKTVTRRSGGAEVTETEIASGVMTINERRRHKNRPPVAHGDEPLINTTNMPLARLFETPPASDPATAPNPKTPAR